MSEKQLIDANKYLETGSHIGTKFKSGDMKRYIYKKRKDKLLVLNVETIDKRIKIAADFLARFKPEEIVAVSRKLYGCKSVKMFAKIVGARALTGRFVPGTFTNPQGKEFIEPKVVIVTEPDSDFQAIREATRVRAPVIALASTNNSLRDVDLVIPVNNKGRKSIALVYWLLSRELSKAHGLIKKYSDFKEKEEDFEQAVDETTALEGEETEKRDNREKRGFQRRSYRENRDGRRPQRRNR